MIFRDNGRGKVLGSSTLIIPGFSKLKNVMFVEKHTVNLIGVSQLCDEDLHVQFTKEKWLVNN